MNPTAQHPSFGLFIVALIVFLAIASLIREPYSTWFVSVVVVGMVIIDYERNGDKENVWKVLGA